MIIESVKAWCVRVPTLTKWMNSPEFGEHGHRADKRLILKIQGEDGSYGLGETPMRGQEITEEVINRLRGSDETSLQSAFLDLRDPDELYWQRPAPPSEYTPPRHNSKHRLLHPMQTAVEMALTDWRARRLGVPLNHLLGGPWRDRIEIDYWMGRVTVDEARVRAERALSLGFKGLKCKTTLEDPNVERLEAILEVAGPDFGVTVDPNGRSTAAIAEGANIAIWHGSGLDLGVATAAQLHLAASAPNCTLPGDQASAWLREHMLIAESFEVKDGTISVPPGPGLGVTLDEDALAHYAVETWG